MARDVLAETSKFLSYVLRHSPQSIGIMLDKHGWAEIDELVARAQIAGKIIDRDLIVQIVGAPGKKRFALSDNGKLIRALQGHTLAEVSIDFCIKTPPRDLFHGTAQRFVKSIMSEGLRPGNRHYVHLTENEETAVSSGKRYGRPIVLKVDSARMERLDYKFYQAENGVWLTRGVPAEFLSISFNPADSAITSK
ncbi:RNA 2'-phosphotransferase [Xaviernesmea oryzae]|uniref:RNA 2'-phosphotransferase n=1 Tax=Xaviernesmea oryzae TaxID=464029 RepID=UPI0008C415BA|nr:RNA 2'-phosphotransferase [Xaviernesmea oryzae]SEM39154.1 putative RNA 2'-phosphotransferase [Xaviernesmea oryzae]